MSRRSLALLSLALGTLTLGACSDITAPTATSERQISPTVPSADTCKSGFADSTGKGC
jgi:hypothetical protein